MNAACDGSCLILSFLCRILAAVPATKKALNVNGSAAVSMPHPRGGPCDEMRNRMKEFSVVLFLCRILAAVPATPCQLAREETIMSFYAASSRRSLRQKMPLVMVLVLFAFLCRILAAVPATLQRQPGKCRNFSFLCRILAAVPATANSEICSVGNRPVSMPHPRGGPCDAHYINGVKKPVIGFYAASSRRSLRHKDSLVWGKNTQGFYAASSRRSLRLQMEALTKLSKPSFYAASSRRSLRLLPIFWSVNH